MKRRREEAKAQPDATRVGRVAEPARSLTPLPVPPTLRACPFACTTSLAGLGQHRARPAPRARHPSGHASVSGPTCVCSECPGGGVETTRAPARCMVCRVWNRRRYMYQGSRRKHPEAPAHHCLLHATTSLPAGPAHVDLAEPTTATGPVHVDLAEPTTGNRPALLPKSVAAPDFSGILAPEPLPPPGCPVLFSVLANAPR